VLCSSYYTPVPPIESIHKEIWENRVFEKKIEDDWNNTELEQSLNNSIFGINNNNKPQSRQSCIA